MPVLTLFEHETRPFDWTERDLGLIEKLNSLAGCELLRAGVRSSQHTLQARQQVGVMRFGKHAVQVLPKIYRASAATDEKTQAREASLNLLHLLAVAGEFAVREQEISLLTRREQDWFEILIHIFASHLSQEWQRGVHRHYQTVEADLGVLKGQWRIGDQMRRPEQRHQFSVRYDEFSDDNPLNRVFRFVVERLWNLSRAAENRRQLSILRALMDGVQCMPSVTLVEAEAIPLNRLNQRYEPLLNLAKLFLDDSVLRLAVGDQMNFAFAFDMNALYEAFVVNFICRHRQEILPEALQACELLPQTCGATRYLARRAEQDVFQLKPDLAFHVGGQFPLLLDAKYKLLKESDRNLGVVRDDFYQMYAYARQYACERVIILYPQTAELTKSLNAQFTLEKQAGEIRVDTLDIRLDLGSMSGRDSLIQQFKTILEMRNDE